jgi:hypothetical protein
MARYLAVAVLALAFGSRAWAGGPPPVYVVVDKVVLEPNADAPERIRIEGCFVRQTEELLRELSEKGIPWESTYGKPVEGDVYMSIEPGKEKECRAEWAKWQKAAGTGKVVAVGACVLGGSLHTVKIRKLDEKTTRPDAVYTTDYLEAGGQSYVEDDGERATFGLRFAPVKDLLAFAKARQKTKTDNK